MEYEYSVVRIQGFMQVHLVGDELTFSMTKGLANQEM